MECFEEKERAYGELIAHRYDHDYHRALVQREHDRDFAKFVAGYFAEGDRVLDLGCGPGSMWPHWLEVLDGGASLTGVDISEAMIREAGRKYAGGDFRVGSALDIPLQTGSVDLVIASSVLHHIPDMHLERALSEIYRVLEEHGKVVGREPIGTRRIADEPGWLSGAVMNFRHMVYRLSGTKEYPEPEIGEHHHAYDPSTFAAILGKHFTVREMEKKYPVSGYLERCESVQVAKVANILDDVAGSTTGNEFYYAAWKNWADAKTVRRCTRKAAGEGTPFNRIKFLAYLHEAARSLEKDLGSGAGDSLSRSSKD